jgi:hypothetical protein
MVVNYLHEVASVLFQSQKKHPATVVETYMRSKRSEGSKQEKNVA